MNNLKELRKQKNKTQQDVEKETGINQKNYSRYENGVTEPDIETLKKLADYFGTSIDYIVGRLSKIIELDSFPDYKRELLENSIKLNERECEKANAYVSGLLSAGYSREEVIKKFNEEYNK